MTQAKNQKKTPRVPEPCGTGTQRAQIETFVSKRHENSSSSLPSGRHYAKFSAQPILGWIGTHKNPFSDKDYAPDLLTVSIRILRVNNFIYGLLSDPMDYDFRGMLSGRP